LRTVRRSERSCICNPRRTDILRLAPRIALQHIVSCAGTSAPCILEPNRIPKFLGYFERILRRNNDGADFMFGKRVSYVDLSLFQMIEGSRYAFSRTMERLESQHPRLIMVHDRVMARPNIAAYLSSPAATAVQSARHLSSLSRTRRGIDGRIPRRFHCPTRASAARFLLTSVHGSLSFS
jgi:hypothetical protein